MPARALTAEEVAAELGRSKAWIYEHWRRLVAEGRIPPPISEAGHLVWSAAQLYAYLDRDLPAKLRPLVAAHRAALDAAAAAPRERIAGDAIEAARAGLDRRFARQEEG
jgi:predicted DNA-binding transcriptional regulator AlpA